MLLFRLMTPIVEVYVLHLYIQPPELCDDCHFAKKKTVQKYNLG